MEKKLGMGRLLDFSKAAKRSRLAAEPDFNWHDIFRDTQDHVSAVGINSTMLDVGYAYSGCELAGQIKRFRQLASDLDKVMSRINQLVPYHDEEDG